MTKQSKADYLKKNRGKIKAIGLQATEQFDHSEYLKASTSYFKLLTLLRKRRLETNSAFTDEAHTRFNLGVSIKNEVIENSDKYTRSKQLQMLETSMDWLKSASDLYKRSADIKQCSQEMHEVNEWQAQMSGNRR